MADNLSYFLSRQVSFRCEPLWYETGDAKLLRGTKPSCSCDLLANSQCTSMDERKRGRNRSRSRRWREKKVVLECFKFMSAAATVVRSPALGGGGGRKSHIEPPTRYMNLTASTPVSWNFRIELRIGSARRPSSCWPRRGLRPFGSGE